MPQSQISRGISSQGPAFAAAIARRHDRHMPGNPFPSHSPWGRELDHMHAADVAQQRFGRECARTGYGMRLSGQGRAAR